MGNLEEYLVAKTPAEIQIKNYILENASDVLKEKIINSKKNVTDCINYVSGQVRKNAVKSCYCATDEEVYGMCIHYFEEDSINVESTASASVSTSKQTPKKKEAPKPKKEEPDQKGYEQMSLFDM